MKIEDLDYTYDIFQRPGPAVTSQLNAEQVSNLKQILQPGPAQAIGSAANSSSSRANIETAIDVAAPAISTHVNQLQELELAAGTIGGRRLLAKLSNIVQPENGDLLVNVFVDCPYLSPSTPSTDPHYAGTFSFFGAAQKMQGMDMNSVSYVVDITEPVRQAGLAEDKIRVQLMPLTGASGRESNSTFQVGKVEILSV